MFRFESTYKVRINDDLGSGTFWNARLQDIDLRINFCESYAARIETAIEEVVTQGLNRINTTTTPLINNLVDQLNILTGEVASLQDLVITDQDSVINQLTALLTEAQGLVANLESLGTISDGTF